MSDEVTITRARYEAYKAAEACAALYRRQLELWLKAHDTGRSEPLFIARDATRNILEMPPPPVRR